MSAPDDRAGRDAQSEPRDMRTDVALRALVRDALAADEPADVPAFADVYAAARRRNAAAVGAGPAAPSFRQRYVLAGAVASAVVVAVALLLVRPWDGARDAPALARDAARDASLAATAGRSATGTADAAARADAALAASDPDYAAALSLRRSMRAGTPLDPMLASLPRTVARGLPDLPEYRYPLLPEDAPLGASSSSRNPS